MNDNNLNQLNKDYIELLHWFIKVVFEEKKLNDNELSDLKEIDQWKYIIFKFILKSKLVLSTNMNFLESYLLCFSEENKENEIAKHNYSQDQIIIFEFIRDYLELKKDNSEIEISQINLNLICSVFLNNLDNLDTILDNFKRCSFTDYLDYQNDSNNYVSINFKLFLCIVDILSNLLPIKENREFILKNFALELILDKCYILLSTTDYFYDTFYKRNKIKENFEGVPENNIFYCFQTNIVKFLANYFFANQEAKKYYLDQNNSLRFYYLLNHMKIDKSNPFKKEWSVLVVKALCEGICKII